MTLFLENVSPQVGRRIGVIGTSLVQMNDVASATKISYSSRGWLRWAQVLSNQAFYCPIWNDQTFYPGWEPSGVAGSTRGFRGLNAGVNGQQRLEIFARKEYFTTLGCDTVIIDCGTNDVGGTDALTIQATREALADYYLSVGIRPVLLPILARGTAAWLSGSATRNRANHVNRLTREYYNKRRGLFPFDWNAAWVDMQQSVDSIPRVGYSDDGTHFAPIGGYFVGKALAAFLATFIPPAQPRVWGQDDKFNAADNPQGNLLPNPFMVGSAGTNGLGSTGVVADGMRVERSSGATTVVASKETKVDGRGFNQVMTFTPSGGAVDLLYLRTNSVNIAHNAAAGDWMIASCKVEASAYPWRGISLYAQDQASGGQGAYGLEPFPSAFSSTLNWQGVEAWSGAIETPPFQLVSGSTDVRWRVEVRIDTTQGGSPVLKVGEVELRRITSPLTILGAVN